MTPEGAAATAFPGGHVEGYPDTFRALLTAVYHDIAEGGPADEPTYPTFAEGHDIMAVCDRSRHRPAARPGRRSIDDENDTRR